MTHYDVAVIGGGAVGCAVLHELTNHGWNCILLEKEPHLVSGASKGNSGLLATGFDADPKSLESTLLKKAAGLNKILYKRYKLPLKDIGGLIIAWNNDELAKLPSIVEEAHGVGQTSVRQISKQEISRLEPHLSQDAFGGVLVPGEAVVDPWLVPVTLAHHARRQGARVCCKCEVQNVTRHSGIWKLTTSHEPVTASVVVNAAGLYGDHVEEMSHPSKFRIHPRKGEYAVFSKTSGHLISHIILPVPTKRTKGIILFPTVYGNLIVGPTAEDVSERQNATVSPKTIDKLLEFSYKVIPSLKQHHVVGTYAGLRPATQDQDYHIYAHKNRNWITVGGIRSTGLTASLAIAKHVSGLLKEELQQEPSRSVIQTSRQAASWYTDRGTAVMDGTEYTVTHPITLFGQSKNTASKL